MQIDEFSLIFIPGGNTMKMEMSGNKIMNPHRNGKQMEYFERRVRSWGLIALCALAIAVFFCFPFANG